MTTRRRWFEIRARSRSAGEQDALLVEGLVALGGRAVEEIDGWFVTQVDEEPDDPDAHLRRTYQRLGELTGLDDIELDWRWRNHEDWSETWKRGLAPRRLTDRLVVTTTWHPVEAGPNDIVIVIDPGMAFGTAEHGTTRGCLRLLDGAVREGDDVLDIGAGSGILSIAAAGLGAKTVLAIEGDPLAVQALEENVARSDARDRIRWETRWADPDFLAQRGPWDGIVANIESGVLRPLLSAFAGAVSPGGWLILSGILEEEWPEMSAATESAGFELLRTDEDGEWRSGRFTRLGPA